MNKLVSIVIPAYNEEKNILPLYEALEGAVADPSLAGFAFEIIFVNDGSSDKTEDIILGIRARDSRVKYLEFSRNFGKEIATTAGIRHAAGDAVIMMDADLQHPPGLIPEFIAKWENGGEVIIGVRKESKGGSFVKKIGSKFFYAIMSRIGETKIVPNSTDFRLIDRKVAEEFNRLTERNRMTRGLIAWLGFRRVFVNFDAPARRNGEAGYSFSKLVKLALSSFVSHSFFPLRFAGYLGIFITAAAGLLGLFIFIEKYVLNDPWGLDFSGPAILAVVILFLVGIVLSCLGLIALYIANIHSEVANRPLYVIREKKL